MAPDGLFVGLFVSFGGGKAVGGLGEITGNSLYKTMTYVGNQPVQLVAIIIVIGKPAVGENPNIRKVRSNQEGAIDQLSRYSSPEFYIIFSAHFSVYNKLLCSRLTTSTRRCVIIIFRLFRL